MIVRFFFLFLTYGLISLSAKAQITYVQNVEQKSQLVNIRLKHDASFSGRTQNYGVEISNKTGDKLFLHLEYWANLRCGNRHSDATKVDLKPGETLVPKEFTSMDPRDLAATLSTDEWCPPKPEWTSVISGMGYRIVEIRNLSEEERQDRQKREAAAERQKQAEQQRQEQARAMAAKNEGGVTPSKTTSTGNTSTATAARKNNTDFWDDKPSSGAVRRTDTRSDQQQLADVNRQIQKQNEDYWRKVNATNQKIEQQNRLYVQSFYAAQALADAKQNVRDISRLSGNYSSVEELEAEFDEKYQSVSQEVNNLTAARNEALSSHINSALANTDETTQAVGQTVAMVGALINDAKADREKAAAREALRKQREEQLAAIERKQKALLLNLRNSFLSQFPEGGVPISTTKVSESEIYFFAYTFDRSRVEEQNPEIQLINVFSTAKYSDDTWPYKASITSELTKLTGQKVTLMGYYTTKALATDMYNSFVRLAEKSKFKIKQVSYNKKASAPASTTEAKSADFWEDGGTKKSEAPKKEQDFWND